MVTKLVELIYDAALDETRWEDFLHQTPSILRPGRQSCLYTI